MGDWDVLHTDLALVNGDGPGQFEWQLLAAQVDPSPRLEHPSLGLHGLGDSAQETHSRVTYGNRRSKRQRLIQVKGRL